MADLSIKNLPSELYRRLKRSAKRHRRSLNKEIVYRIEIGLQTAMERSPAQIRDIVQTTRKLRRKLKSQDVWITDEEIQIAKRQGRP